MGAVLRSLLGRLDSSPWGLLQAVPPVPMAAPLRQAAVLALQAAVQVTSPLRPSSLSALTRPGCPRIIDCMTVHLCLPSAPSAPTGGLARLTAPVLYQLTA